MRCDILAQGVVMLQKKYIRYRYCQIAGTNLKREKKY